VLSNTKTVSSKPNLRESGAAAMLARREDALRRANVLRRPRAQLKRDRTAGVGQERRCWLIRRGSC
jgi:hypothetical protein